MLEAPSILCKWNNGTIRTVTYTLKEKSNMAECDSYIQGIGLWISVCFMLCAVSSSALWSSWQCSLARRSKNLILAPSDISSVTSDANFPKFFKGT